MRIEADKTLTPELEGGLSIADVAARIRIGREGGMKKFVQIDRGVVDRFRDASTTAIAGVAEGSSARFFPGDDEDDFPDGDTPDSLPIGPTSRLTTSEYTKVAAIVNKHPDFRCTLKKNVPPEANGATEIVRAKARKDWAKYNWQRVSRKSYLKECLTGMGFTRWYWHREERHACYEHVHPSNLSIDPCTTDWQNLRYAAVCIRKPLREAMAMYPEYYATMSEGERLNGGGRLDKEKVKIWIYYDWYNCVHLLEDGWNKLKVEPNTYKRKWEKKARIPIIVGEGKIDPGFSVFGLGDGVLAAGAQQEISDIQAIISHKAKHTGPVTIYNSRLLGENKNALEDGKKGQWIPAADTSEPPILRVPGEDIEPSEIQALQMAEASLDQMVGVNDPMRGVLGSGRNTATEVSLVASQSGANSSDAGAQYELFIDRWAETWLFMQQEFAGPEEGVDLTPLELSEWEAANYVDEISVVELSTAWRDPAANLTQSMTFYQQDVNSAELYIALSQMGATDRIPNLAWSRERVLRAMGVENTDDAWAQPPQQAPQGEDNGHEIMIKALQAIYRDSPPDVRRQIEQQFGLQPSQLGDEPEGDETAAQPNPELEIAKQEDQQSHDAAMQSSQHAHDLRMQGMKHQQALQLEQMKLQHQAQIKAAEISHQARQQQGDRELKERQAGEDRALQAKVADTNAQVKQQELQARSAEKKAEKATKKP